MLELFQNLDVAWQLGIVFGGGTALCACVAKVLADLI